MVGVVLVCSGLRGSGMGKEVTLYGTLWGGVLGET